MVYLYEYPRPAVTVETVVFDLYDDDKIPAVLLIRRMNEPFRNMWAIPGGFLDLDEELEDGAIRELLEETGIVVSNNIRQAFTVGGLNRDPRGRVISVVHTAVVDRFEHRVCAGDDAIDAAWFKMDELPELAADHLEIIRQTLGEVYYDRT